jgi:class 3 adenylate cyclase
VDDGGDGRGALTAAGLTCGSCGTHLAATAKFCSECGSPAAHAIQSAEYKQVTVLFADVVHSMDIAAKVGAERLREIMTELVNRAAAAVQRFGGTVGSFTGDGIMAVFGAPAALEDHAVRACLAASAVQEAAKQLAVDVEDRDGVDLQLRVGLNSGQVIAGEMGSGPFGYTTIGEQVGMAQRMESVASAGGVMLSESTARLVERDAVLDEPQFVHIKGVVEPVRAQRLLAVGPQHRGISRPDAALVGRQWELATVAGILDRSISGHGCVVGVAGPAGIGKSRIVDEAAAMARRHGIPVFSTFCESHATEVPFHVVARLLRDATGISHLDDEAARLQVRVQFSDASNEDIVLLHDLLGVGDPQVAIPNIDPDARRRRLTALINSASLVRPESAIYIIEDAHWIDEVSESMLADFLAIIPQTHTTVLITYRPEYRGLLAHMPGAQTISLAPLTDSETTALLDDLLGLDASVGDIKTLIAGRAAGNPFFAGEMVRDFAERGVLKGERGGHTCSTDLAEVSVPATLQAAIAARIDRLDAGAKQTLNAAAVVGSRFTAELLAVLGISPILDGLMKAELIDQVRFTPVPEYAFRHPLIRTVAYESQLKSDRARLHRRLAAEIEAGEPGSVDENAALIAEHLEAAGELRRAYEWHMRAGAWSANRVVEASMVSWQRARQIADSLPSGDADCTAMRIAPRTLMCLNAFRVNMNRDDVSFEELREMCIAAGDKASLAIAMSGLVGGHMIYGRVREASLLESDVMALAEQIGDPALIIGMSLAPIAIKIVTGEMAEVLRLAQRVIDLAEGDPTRGNFVGVGSPLTAALASRGVARFWLGLPGWREDFEQADAMPKDASPLARSITAYWMYGLPTVHGVLRTNDSVVREIAEALQLAERCADDIALGVARATMAHALMRQYSPADRERGLELLGQLGEMCRQGRYYQSELPIVSMYSAQEMVIRGDRQDAVVLMRAAIDDLFSSGQLPHCLLATHALVEILVERQDDGEVAEAEAAVERLTAAPAEDGLVVRDIWLLRLRAVLARARGETAAYRDYRDRYRDLARSLGFEGHMEWADAMA